MAAYASSFVPCNVWGAMPADERRVYSAIGYTYLHRQTERDRERERETWHACSGFRVARVRCGVR